MHHHNPFLRNQFPSFSLSSLRSIPSVYSSEKSLWCHPSAYYGSSLSAGWNSKFLASISDPSMIKFTSSSPASHLLTRCSPSLRKKLLLPTSIWLFLPYQNSLQCLNPLISTWYSKQDQSQIRNSYKVFPSSLNWKPNFPKYLRLVHSSLTSLNTFFVPSPWDPATNDSVSITHWLATNLGLPVFMSYPPQQIGGPGWKGPFSLHSVWNLLGTPELTRKWINGVGCQAGLEEWFG